MVVSPRTLDRLAGAAGRARAHDEYFTRPYSAGVASLAHRGHADPPVTVDDGSGAVDPVGPARRRQLDAARPAHRRLQPEGRRGQDDDRHQPGRGARRDGPVRAPRRRRHGHRPRRRARSAWSMSGRSSMRSPTPARRVRGQPPSTLDELVAAHPSGLQVLSLSSSPLKTRGPRPGPGRRRDRPRAPLLRRHRRRPPPRLRPAQPRDVRAGGPDPGAGDAGRAGAPGGRPAARRRRRARLPRPSSRWSSTAPTAASSVADMESTVGMAAFAAIRSAGLQLVKAANEGRTVIDLSPTEKIIGRLPGPRRARRRRSAGPKRPGARRSAACSGAKESGAGGAEALPGISSPAEPCGLRAPPPRRTGRPAPRHAGRSG